jgi:RNA polymerase sigma-70 factor (ECF subfamily)
MDQENLLLVQVKNGDRKAFELFTERFWKPIYHLAYRFSGSAEDAEDLCQEIFFSVFQKAETFRGEGGAFTWLYRLATNTCLNWKRKQKRKILFLFSMEKGKAERSAGDQAVIRLEIQDAFYSLQPQDRILLLLRKFYGFSYDEIGEVFLISSDKVKSRLHEAKCRLAEKLKDTKQEGGQSWNAQRSNSV